MSKNTVTPKQIENIWNKSEISISTKFNKTTIVTAHLPNGFVIVESSSCVDPANYDEKMGYEICVERIKNKLWELEGYKLQDALSVRG